MSNKLLKSLNQEPIKKPAKHTGDENTNHYELNLSKNDYHEIADILLTLEANAVTEEEKNAMNKEEYNESNPS